MKQAELSKELRRRYDSAKRSQVILEIDLFGIDFGEVIRNNGFSIKTIVSKAGIQPSYITEVSKGVKLSEYVIRKKEK